MLRVTISNDIDNENPSEWWGGVWRFVPFDCRFVGAEDASDYVCVSKGELVGANIGIRRKLESGTAFLVEMYEHSGRVWSLRGEGHQCRWDTTSVAGILLCDRPKELPEDRRQAARDFLELYTAWAEGNIYHYSIEREIDGDIEDIDSCGGFYDIGKDCGGMFHEIRHLLSQYPGEEVVVEGQAKWLADYNDLGLKDDHVLTPSGS